MRRTLALLLLAGCSATPPVSEVDAGGLRQPTPVSALAFSPDGKLLLSGDPEGIVRVWDVEAGKLLRGFEAIGVPVVRIVVSPDGSRLAALSSRDRVTVFPLHEGLAARTIDAGHVIRTAAFLPDGTALVTAGEGRRVECWDLAAGEARWMVDESSFPVQQVLAAPDGASVAVRLRNGKVTLRNSHDGESLLALPGFLPANTIAGFLPDSRFAVFAGDPVVWTPGTRERGTLAPWEVRLLPWPGPRRAWLPALQHATTGEELILLETHDPHGPPIVISRNGSRLASGGLDGRLQVLDPRKPGTAISPFAGTVAQLAISPGGLYIAAWGPYDRGVRAWPSDRPGCVEYVLGGKQNRFVFTSEDTLRICSDGISGTSKLATVNGEFKVTPQEEVEFPRSSVVGVSRGGAAFATLSKGVVTVRVGGKVVNQQAVPAGFEVDELIPSDDGATITAVNRRQAALLRLTTKEVLRVDLKPAANAGLAWVDISPNGDQILFPAPSDRLVQFDLEAKAPVRFLSSELGRPTSGALFRDGIRVAAGLQDGRLLIFRTEGPPALLSARHAGRVVAIALSQDEHHLASAGDDGTVLVHYLGPR